jgi:hypothetical protein
VLFKGTMQLTVTKDSRPDAGTMTGTLNGTDKPGSPARLTVSGGWTCSPGSNLGPG